MTDLKNDKSMNTETLAPPPCGQEDVLCEHRAGLNEQINSLKDQNARMELMLSMTPGLLVENLDDINKVRIEGNGVVRFGLKAGLMEKELFLKRIHPSDFIHYIINYGKFADGTYSAANEVREELRFQLEDGSFVWTECVFTVSSAVADTKRIMCTFYDIDEQKQKIREHGDIIQSLSNQYSILIIVDLKNDKYDVIKDERGLERRIPEHGTYERLNRIFFGIRVAADGRKNLTGQLTIENIIEQLSASNQVMEVEYQRNSEKGSEERWERLTIIEVAKEDNKASLVMLGINDISEQKKEEIRNRQMIQDAMLAANQANHAKSDFLSRMSHDIRTPLNAIIGMSGIAQKNINNHERMSDCLEKIDSAGKHLLDLVNEVLDMSRIESGRLTIIAEELDLLEMINNIHSIVGNLAEQNSHSLTVSTEGLTHPKVLGDPSRIQQILMNLLSNAVKYTPKGGKISFTAKELGSNAYVFIVEDNGVGMTPEFVKEIYDPFSRVDDSRTSKIEGSGLGMAIVQNLVLMMNGNIKVESAVGKGSTFIVTLPLKRMEQTVQEEAADKSELLTEFPDKRILIAEDNELNMEIAVDLLEITGATIETAENGLVALTKVSEKPAFYYDLVFMDMQMPVMNGYDATKAIRHLNKEDSESLPIVALTANAFVEDVQKTREAGMNDHVAKPVSFDQLLAVMNKYIV